MGVGVFTEHIEKDPEPVCGEASSPEGQDPDVSLTVHPSSSSPPSPLPPLSSLPSTEYGEASVEADTPSHTAQDPSTQVSVSEFKFRLLAALIFLGFFTCLVDPVLVAPALHPIATELKALVAVNWVVLTFTVTQCVFCLVSARLADHFWQRGYALQVAMVIFSAGSLVCYLAHSLPLMIAGRGVQGIAAGAVFSLTMRVLPEVCPAHLVQWMPAVGTSVIFLACTLGPVMGGVFTQFTGWRSIFLCDTLITLICASMLFMLWPGRGRTHSMPLKPWKHFDYAGSMLAVCGISALVFGFQYVGMSIRKDVWASHWFIIPLVVGTILCLVLLIWEYCVGRRASAGVWSFVPVLPLSLFAKLSYSCGVAASLFQGFTLFLLIFFVPLRFNMVSEKSPFLSALMSLPLLGSFVVGCFAAGVVNFRWKGRVYYATNYIGSLVSLVGFGLLCSVRGAQDDVKFMIYLAVVGLGLGINITTATLITRSETPSHTAEPAILINHSARLLGASFGIAAFSILVHNEIVAALPEGITEKDLADLLANPKSALSSMFTSFMGEGLNAAFKNAMLVCVVMAALAQICALVPFVFDVLAKRRAARQAAIPMQSV